MKKTVAAVALGAAFPLFAGLGVSATADFTASAGKLRPDLHCSSWYARSYPRGLVKDDDAIRALNQTAFRTHDAPLVNNGQHVVDTHCIFPLEHLDPKDPKNYRFEPTDHFIKINLDLGMKCFYRLGSSIEHTGDWGYNTLNPKDHARYAESLAGIVRHYTRGWANGFKWGDKMQYWELFNEPNVKACWRGTQDEFIDLFIVCLKRLKSEFPELKVGGPAFGWYDEPWMKKLLQACKDAGATPDFFSWHYYGDEPEVILAQPAKVRALVDSYGFTKCELIVNEWHYLLNGNWNGVQASSSPDMMQQVEEGATGIKNIDSAVFTIQVETGFHDTPLDQSYYYGSGFNGNWGYVDRFRRFAKVYYAMRMLGEMQAACSERAKCVGNWKGVAAFGAWTKDRKGAQLIVTDYRGTEQLLEVEVKGLDQAKHVSVKVLDSERNLIPTTDFEWRNGKLTLVKSERRSAAFLVAFEL